MLPGRRRPGAPGRSCSAASISAGCASRSNQRRTAASSGGAVRQQRRRKAEHEPRRSRRRSRSAASRPGCRRQSGRAPARSVRRTPVASTASMPGIARWPMKASSRCRSNGSRKPSRTADAVGRLGRRRAAIGAQPRRWHAVALGEGRIEAPQAAEAAGQRHLRDRQCAVGQQLLGEQQAPRLQVLQGRDAMLGEEDAAQVALADAQPPRQAPRRRSHRHRRCNGRAAIAACRASVRDASITLQAMPVPGASSGRHFRHGRNDAASARAALSKKRQFSRRGARTRQIGRQ